MNWSDISGEYYDYTETMEPEKPYNYDYSKTMTMKLLLSVPTQDGGTKVFFTFAQALEVIRCVDRLSREIPKILYLVGWQFHGHDDKYPSFACVNEALKRTQDADGAESLKWLMREAAVYHTTVSLHINMTDAYEDSPLWQEYLENELIAKNEDGSYMATGIWGAGKTAYQICYKKEWESGYAIRRINGLLAMLPIEAAGTIHIDAYICRQSSDSSLEEERNARRKVIRYFRRRGIDVTTEFLYRFPGMDQGKLPKEIAKQQADDLIGLVPMIWWLNQEQEDYIKRPVSLICGGRYNEDLNTCGFEGLGFLTGNGVHGESQFDGFRISREEGEKRFLETFCLDGAAWYYQNCRRLLGFEGSAGRTRAIYNDGLEAELAGHRLIEKGVLLREGNDICIPLLWREKELLLYTSDGYTNKCWRLPKEFCGLRVKEILSLSTVNPAQILNSILLSNESITLSLKKQEAWIIVFDG